MSDSKSSAGWLARWYASPLSVDAANELLRQADEREQRQRRRGVDCLTCRLQKMVAHFWLGAPIDHEFEVLSRTRRGSIHARIGAELLYGQLLMSRRLPGGMAHLERVFEWGSHLLQSADYFVLIKRHQMLRRLPLMPQSHPPATLEQLLTTSAIMQRLQQGQLDQPRGHDPNDIYG